MKMRVISVAVALPLLFIVLFLLPSPVLPVVLAALSALAAYELLHATGILTAPGPLGLCVAAAGVQALCLYFFNSWGFLPIFILALFVLAMRDRERVKCAQITAAVFAAAFFPMALIAVAHIRDMHIALVMLPFLAAWVTDTFAFFVGHALGRHKLAPYISPKKTVEGSVGGFIGCIGVMLLYAWPARAIWGVELSLPVLALIGAVGGIVSQIGDLSMSLIKREHGLKDFGTIMPGHGGVLDRFDSVLFTAPLTELILRLVNIL